MEKNICLRDPPSDKPPFLLSQSGRNPYPNPYISNSQESLPSARLYSHPSHPVRESDAQHLLEQVLRVWQIIIKLLHYVIVVALQVHTCLFVQKPRLAHALCDYTPPHTAHLHFLRGDVIDLLDCSSSMSWRGRCRGRVGVFPPEYVQPLYHWHHIKPVTLHRWNHSLCKDGRVCNTSQLLHVFKVRGSGAVRSIFIYSLGLKLTSGPADRC